MWWNNFFAKVIDPYLTVLNSLPKVALGPIIIIIFGANINSIIIMALLISLIITISNVYSGFINTDKNKIKLLILDVDNTLIDYYKNLSEEVIKWAKENKIMTGTTIMIGDGYTDLETFLEGAVDYHIYFAGVINRDNVKNKSNLIANNIQELEKLCIDFIK